MGRTQKDDGLPIRAKGSDRSLRALQSMVGPMAMLCVTLLLGFGVIGFIVYKTSRPPQRTSGLGSPDETQLPDAISGSALSGEDVYKTLLKSTVFVLITDGTSYHQPLAGGSGVLVHGPRRLVLTNYHVVTDRSSAIVFFPRYERNGELISRPKYYKDNIKSFGIKARVVYRDSSKDLALLELPSIPSNVAPISLATQPAATGSMLYSVGSSGVEFPAFSGTLWRMSSGEVRGRNAQKLTAIGAGELNTVDAMLLKSQKPVNPGDSGGPSVNAAGGLTGLVCLLDLSRNTVSFDIDVIEIERFLQRYAHEGRWVWDGPRMEFKK